MTRPRWVSRACAWIDNPTSGYCVSTVGLDEVMIRAYIRNQEKEEKRQDDLPFGGL